ncbi:MAG: NUDIX domain-containing protein [Candidatus Nanoarchaeia archaeon]
MPIKKCAGALIFNNEYKLFLMTSPKWQGWLIPGGKIEDKETPEEALKREIKEELNIDLKNITFIEEHFKQASSDFYDPTVTFHFFSYVAQAVQTTITPNKEITTYNWFSIEEALNLPLVDSTKALILTYRKLKS